MGSLDIVTGVMLTVYSTCFAGTVASSSAPPPWEVWHDLSTLAHLDLDDQVYLRSSHCPDGCRYDRHAPDDWRFTRVIGDEGVIFEEAGAGAISRIWMTMGDGVSQDLDSSISIRITLDGETTPSVDMPLPDFFSGAVPPFEAPLVGNRTVSGGGNYSYVPIAFRDGCRVSLIGAENKKIWFQITFHRFNDKARVTSFTGEEDLSRWSSLLQEPGVDPWPQSPVEPLTGHLVLAPGESVDLTDLDGPDILTAILLDVDPDSWSTLSLTLIFDGKPTVQMPLSDFFAIGRATHEPTQSVLVGASLDGLYSYFPMPFFKSAGVHLTNPADSTSGPVALDFEIRRAGRLPTSNSGIFGAQLRVAERTTPGKDTTILELDGHGKWVGIFAEIGSVDGQDRQYLEGDERVFFDGARHPMIYGTGVEDTFGGGFYFRVNDTNPSPFRLALHGMTYDERIGDDTIMGMYRMMLSDAPTFASSLRVGLEGGPVNDRAMRLRTVSYYYLRDRPALRRKDSLEIGDPASRVEHAYQIIGGGCSYDELDAAFEGEPALQLTATGCYRGQQTAEFVLEGVHPNQQIRLRRRFDAGLPDQRALITADDGADAAVAYGWPNSARRWRETDLMFDRPMPGTDNRIQFTIHPEGESGTVFTAFSYELWTGFVTGACDVNLNGRCEASDIGELVKVLDDPVNDPLGDPDTTNDGEVTVDDLLLIVNAVFD